MVRGGKKMARKVSAMMRTERQSEGMRLAGGSGGKIGHFGRGFVNQQGKQQMGGDPGVGEARVFGRQPVEMQDRFHPLEGELDLPANPVEGGQGFGREGFGVERSDQDQI